MFRRARVFVLFSLAVVACKRTRDRSEVGPDPAASPRVVAAAPLDVGPPPFRVDSSRASRAVIRGSSFMQSDRAKGLALHTFLEDTDVPPAGCWPSDESCVWRFVVRLPRPGTGWGPAIVEICEVHAHSGSVRCTFELTEPFDWRDAGTAFDVVTDAASD